MKFNPYFFPAALFLLLVSGPMASQSYLKNEAHLEEDIEYLLQSLSQDYVYIKDKAVDWSCMREHYKNQIKLVDSEAAEVLLFEEMLNELYDGHVILNTNTNKSYRLYAPLYVEQVNQQFVIRSVWDEIIDLPTFNLIGARILTFNGKSVEDIIRDLPAQCVNKNLPEVKEWLINKSLAGRYHEARILQIQLSDGLIKVIDLDQLTAKKNEGLLEVNKIEGIGIVRFHNSLGNNDLVSQFDNALDQLMDTDGLVLDLRNTVDGGNSYVARGIMSRFISNTLPYQQHEYVEQYGQNPRVIRQWMEMVVPRGRTYTAPIVVLVGRWTGSMGEGLAIGLDGMDRAMIMGTEMERLAGEINYYPFHHRNYGFRMATARLSHIDGTPREKYLPPHYVRDTDSAKNTLVSAAISLLNQHSKAIKNK